MICKLCGWMGNQNASHTAVLKQHAHAAYGRADQFRTDGGEYDASLSPRWEAATIHADTLAVESGRAYRRARAAL